ncbi:hypothetical protein H0H87_007925 [Tephrocybe sp. NHM501043]|nr:hypothetical protein H0H87_007925 [Tephrocybe sp. NHM501043]
MAMKALFNKSVALSYLGLPDDYTPSPEADPIAFLTKHIMQLPPHLLLHFSYITSAKERTVLPVIRNRRLKFANSNLSHVQDFLSEREQSGTQEVQDEKTWAETDFLKGSTKHVGKLGGLLSGYQEEREAERARMLRRERAAVQQFIPEEDDDSSDEEDLVDSLVDDESPEEAKVSFERSVRERLIYGLLEASRSFETEVEPNPRLQSFDYDTVDWDESLDEDDDREAEDRWFDEDDE